MPNCECIEYLGYVAAAYLSIKIGLGFLRCFSKSFLSRPTNVSKMGEWALVTGSTDGIGKAYAFALAKRGLNIVLVSRSPFKLQNVAAEIESKCKVKTKIIDVDFSHDEASFKGKIESGIKVRRSGEK